MLLVIITHIIYISLMTHINYIFAILVILFFWEYIKKILVGRTFTWYARILYSYTEAILQVVN